MSDKTMQTVADELVPAIQQFQGRDGTWHNFIDDRHFQNTVEDGSWPLRNLYTQEAVDTLRTQLAEAQRRIKELETPTMFWDFNNPEHGAFDSPYYAICDGDFDEGAEVSFMTARSLPTKTVRVTHDSEGNYDYKYIDTAKGE